MSVLRTALCLFAGLVRVSRSVHFTNAEWEVYENQSITLEWAYDSDDNPDPDEYAITIWLPFGTELLPWSGNYSHMLFNMSYNADVTSYTWTFDCDFNLTTGDKYVFSICGLQWGTLVSIDDSDAWTLQAGNTPCHPTAEGTSLSTGAKAGIGVGVSVGVIAIAAAVAFLWHRKRTLGKTPVTTVEVAK